MEGAGHLSLLEIWAAIEQFGAPFLLFLAVIAFLRGDLVAGKLARTARKDEVTELNAMHRDSLEVFKQRYEEMQETWKDRYRDITAERDYLRGLAAALSRQTQQSLGIAESITTTTIPPSVRGPDMPPEGR